MDAGAKILQVWLVGSSDNADCILVKVILDTEPNKRFTLFDYNLNEITFTSQELKGMVLSDVARLLIEKSRAFIEEKKQKDPTPLMDKKVRSLLHRHGKLAAIKYIREACRMGLVEAKLYVDDIVQLRSNSSIPTEKRP